MSDIVERLRDRGYDRRYTVAGGIIPGDRLCTEAAAEIERMATEIAALRTECRTLRGDLESTCAIEERLTDELHSFSKEAAATIVTLHARIALLETALVGCLSAWRGTEAEVWGTQAAMERAMAHVADALADARVCNACGGWLRYSHSDGWHCEACEEREDVS